jgi:hypothetical protein
MMEQKPINISKNRILILLKQMFAKRNLHKDEPG